METRVFNLGPIKQKSPESGLTLPGGCPTGGDRDQDVYRRGNVNTRIDLATTIFRAYDLLAHRIPVPSYSFFAFLILALSGISL